MNRAERLGDGEYSLTDDGAALSGFPGPTSQSLIRRPETPFQPHISDGATDPTMSAINGGRGFRSVLRNPLFLRLWLAQLISQTITNAANYGLIILVAQQTNSNLGSSLAIVAFALPAAIFAAPAGVLVDRFDRRTVLWISNALRALAAFGFVLTLLIDSRAFVPVLLLSFFMSTVAQFFSPAEGAAIPALVYPQELMNALALFNITFTLAQALGLIILGPAIIVLVQTICIGTCNVGPTITSTETLFIIVGLLYIVCTLLILSIPSLRLKIRPAPNAPKVNTVADKRQLRSIWAGILESWRFVRRDKRMVQAVVQLCLGGTVIAIVAAISPNFVRVFFNRPKTYAALVFFPAGIGLVLGSALVPAAAQRLRYARTVATGIITLGICAVLLPFVREIAEKIVGPGWWQSWPYLGIAMLLIFFVGISLDLINVPAQTLVQERAPDWMKGRVLALQGMVLNAVTVPAVLIVGTLADRFSLPFALEAVAIAIVVAGLPSVYFATRTGEHSSTHG